MSAYDSAIDIPHMDDDSRLMSTPVQHNVPPTLNIYEDVPTKLGLLVQNEMTQTSKIVSSMSSQTDETVNQTQTVFTQHPTVKKRYVQTYKVLTDISSCQTDALKIKDTSSQCHQRNTCHMATFTDLQIGDDKDNQTDPPVNRHVQTSNVKTKNRQTGCNYKHSETQSDGIEYASAGIQSDVYDCRYMDEYDYDDYEGYDYEECEGDQDELRLKIIQNQKLILESQRRLELLQDGACNKEIVSQVQDSSVT